MKFALISAAVAALAALAQTPAFAAPPPVPFADQPPPPAPDYAKAASWAARPDHEGPAAAVAPGATPANSTAEVDVFYVHPTTYRSDDRWNQDLANATVNTWTDESVIARQAGVFNGCCRVYAPRYRQASSMALWVLDGEGAKAFDLAYQDVREAFDYYLRHDNHGRPFILASHSQGSFHVARLLQEEIDGKPLARQLVAAYVVGFNYSEGDFGKTLKTLPICATPAQTGCVVGWNATLADDSLAAHRTGGERRFVKLYGDTPGKTLLCVNPITFDRARPAAEAAESKGAVPGDPGLGALQPLVPGAVRARCDDGLLIVEPKAELSLKPLPGGSMHYHDLGLFYADVRANAELRVAAYLKARAGK